MPHQKGGWLGRAGLPGPGGGGEGATGGNGGGEGRGAMLEYIAPSPGEGRRSLGMLRAGAGQDRRVLQRRRRHAGGRR